MITDQGKTILNANKTYQSGTSFGGILMPNSISIVDVTGYTHTGTFAIYAGNSSVQSNYIQALSALMKYASPATPSTGLTNTILSGDAYTSPNTSYIYIDIGYRASQPAASETARMGTRYNDIASLSKNNGLIYITVANTYGIEATINEIDIMYTITPYTGSVASTGFNYLHAIYHFSDVTIQPGETYAFKLQYPLT